MLSLQLRQVLRPLSTLAVLLSVPLTFHVQHSWHQWMLSAAVDVPVTLVLVPYSIISSQQAPLSPPAPRAKHQIWKKGDNFLNVRQKPDILHSCTLHFMQQIPALVQPKTTVMSRRTPYLTPPVLQFDHKIFTYVTHTQKIKINFIFIFKNVILSKLSFIFWAASKYSK